MSAALVISRSRAVVLDVAAFSSLKKRGGA
jgi:hypothetical protein